MLKTACTVLFFLACFVSLGNEVGWDDSLNTESDTSRIHLPKRAAILSAIVPGAGQIYNEFGYRRIASKRHRAWWKVPIIYGGLGALGYYFYHNNQMANLTRQEIEKRDELGIEDGYYDERFKDYSDRITLIAGASANSGLSFPGYDKFANRRDIFAFAFVAFWGLNVVEAYVDAHFVTFDVSEDLSLSLNPTLIGYRHPGVNLRFNFN